MMAQNEKKSLEVSKNIILVHPKFAEVDYYEFSKFNEIIDIGYEEAKKTIKLEELNKKFS